MQIYQGKLVGDRLRFGIVVSRFNELISSKLLEGSKDALLRHGVRHQDIDVYWVPGAWETPLVVKEIVLTGKYDAVIALGAVIRGDTPHFDYVAAEVSKGIAHIAADSRVPVAFGVLTCDNLEQALVRAGSKAGNKGFDAAVSALEMANLLREIRAPRSGEQKEQKEEA